MLLAAGAARAENGTSQPVPATEPFGIALEGFPYPYPVHLFPLTQQGEQLRMAYMDVAPKGDANGRTVVLLHGRNFPSSYWQGAIEALAGAGYRVIVPDQIGFNKSSKPAFDLHFDQLARNTRALLDELKVDKVSLVGHSTGGMLSVRFARMYPELVDRIVLVAPIGLEDYRRYVPPIPAERLMELEDKVTPESYLTQLIKGYSLTLSEQALAPYVAARTNVKDSAEYPRWLRAFVNSAQMIWREPVVYEIPLLPQQRAVRHGRERSSRARPRLRAGGAARKNGPECRARSSARRQDAGGPRGSLRGDRPPAASRSAGALQCAGAGLPCRGGVTRGSAPSAMGAAA